MERNDYWLLAVILVLGAGFLALFQDRRFAVSIHPRSLLSEADMWDYTSDYGEYPPDASPTDDQFSQPESIPQDNYGSQSLDYNPRPEIGAPYDTGYRLFGSDFFSNFNGPAPIDLQSNNSRSAFFSTGLSEPLRDDNAWTSWTEDVPREQTGEFGGKINDEVIQRIIKETAKESGGQFRAVEPSANVDSLNSRYSQYGFLGAGSNLQEESNSRSPSNIWQVIKSAFTGEYPMNTEDRNRDVNITKLSPKQIRAEREGVNYSVSRIEGGVYFETGWSINSFFQRVKPKR